MGASEWLGRGVIGWDLAADEGAHPLQKHLKGMNRAVQLGVPVTVHAGEWGSGAQSEANPLLYTKPGHFDTLPNIALALKAGCARIGHGLTLYQDASLMADVAASQMVVECCITSNSRRLGGYAHPISKMLAAGCSCCLNTDNRF